MNAQLEKDLIPVQKAVLKLAKAGQQIEGGDIRSASKWQIRAVRCEVVKGWFSSGHSFLLSATPLHYDMGHTISTGVLHQP